MCLSHLLADSLIYRYIFWVSKNFKLSLTLTISNRRIIAALNSLKCLSALVYSSILPGTQLINTSSSLTPGLRHVYSVIQQMMSGVPLFSCVLVLYLLASRELGKHWLTANMCVCSCGEAKNADICKLQSCMEEGKMETSKYFLLHCPASVRWSCKILVGKSWG